jgi:NhaP-type Na+/H+ and K+/H+ antiporter
LLSQTNNKVEQFLSLVVVTIIMKNFESIFRILSIVIMLSLGVLLIVDGFYALDFDQYSTFFATSYWALGAVFIWLSVYAIICEIKWYRNS